MPTSTPTPTPTPTSEVGQILLAHFESSGLTWRQLYDDYEKAGGKACFSSVKNWIHGRNQPHSASELRRLLTILHVPQRTMRQLAMAWVLGSPELIPGE